MADPTRFVYVTYIRTTPEALWRALIDPEFTRAYWCETVQECAWTPGAPWRILAPNGRVADSGEVVEIDPGRRLVLNWNHHLQPKLGAEGPTRLTCTLEPIGDTVKLTIVHETDRPGSKLIDSLSDGWPAILASLKSLLETGESLALTRTWPEGF